jgi:hypothetical protein
MLRCKSLLTPIQRSFIAEFATLPDQAQFYLAGDTALREFYLGLRRRLMSCWRKRHRKTRGSISTGLRWPSIE